MNGILRRVCTAACLTCSATAAVTLNQIEDFSGNHQWTSGIPNPNPPVIDPDAGPLGQGDAALRVTSNGSNAAGGRLIVFNQTVWTGNYTAAGIVSMAADLRNLGNNPLSIRLAFNGPGGWFITPAAVISAFSGWNQPLFDIRPPALVSAGGVDAAATMVAVGEMRILHSSAADFHGARVSSSFMVDNLRAIPEPTAAAITVLAASLLIFRKR